MKPAEPQFLFALGTTGFAALRAMMIVLLPMIVANPSTVHAEFLLPASPALSSLWFVDVRLAWLGTMLAFQSLILQPHLPTCHTQKIRSLLMSARAAVRASISAHPTLVPARICAGPLLADCTQLSGKQAIALHTVFGFGIGFL